MPPMAAPTVNTIHTAIQVIIWLIYEYRYRLTVETATPSRSAILLWLKP